MKRREKKIVRWKVKRQRKHFCKVSQVVVLNVNCDYIRAMCMCVIMVVAALIYSSRSKYCIFFYVRALSLSLVVFLRCVHFLYGSWKDRTRSVCKYQLCLAMDSRYLFTQFSPFFWHVTISVALTAISLRIMAFNYSEIRIMNVSSIFHPQKCIPTIFSTMHHIQAPESQYQNDALYVIKQYYCHFVL